MERQPPSVRAIFDQAREIDSPGERAAFLDRTCTDAPDVRGEVEALLRAGDDAGSFLETPAAGRLAGELAAGPAGGDTRTGPSVSGTDEPLDFLEPSDKPGSIGRLGHYEVQEVVGRGGMGVVLKAFDESLHRVVAIKVMAPQLAVSATARRRFIREARAAAAVTHDHVVTIHAVEDAGPRPYIVMQYVAGASLQDRLDRTGPLQFHEVLRIGAQTAAGLAAAHAQGLVHRDVKPANILLENGVERVKITDFGLARAADDASLTQAGVVAGTPQYMSPEQAEGKPVDARSDLFSLGSVLYAMCVGRPPFRGSTSRAVLRRVCEETPAQIRETNPEIPDWLCAIVAKLHAKNPADRYQSATEVAELLGRHLAHVQHPSQVSDPTAPGPATARHSRPRKHRWAVAAAVLAAVLATLGTTEATGVTKVRTTVIRFFTPEGTLVVETDDPAVKVTVEGDGDLVITGAGPQEVRLRAGSYRLKATKDGKPVKLDRDLVAISRGDTQIVRVRLEGEPPAVVPPLVVAPVAVVPNVERGAFVVLGDKGIEICKFDTLPEAMQGAGAHDTIEIRGNGPFLTDGLPILNRPLTIRAGEGFRPVIKQSPKEVQMRRYFLSTNAPLVLEGLEFQGVSQVVRAVRGPLQAANCRFGGCISADQITVCDLRNCELLLGGIAGFCLQDGKIRPGSRWTVENCLFRGQGNAVFPPYDNTGPGDVSIQIKSSTFIRPVPPVLVTLQVPLPGLSDPPPTSKPVRVEVSGSIFATPHALYFNQSRALLKKARAKVLERDEAEAALLRLVEWRGERNLFAVGVATVGWTVDLRQEPFHGPRTLKEWQQFWGATDADSLEGRPRFQGGDFLFRTDLETMTTEDFRLRPDSAGYRAGKDSKDLGADIDLVGPGPAYEKWKKTPAYQQWLKDTKQVAKSLDPDRKAAEYVLSIGGTVYVNDESRSRGINAAADLPAEPFRLTAVELSHNKQVSDAGLAAFKGCKNLTHLWVGGTPVTDAGLAHFKDCKNLTSLHLACTLQVSDVGLANFNGCKKLKQLDLEATKVSDAGLAYFRECDLTTLALRFTQVGDVGLAHLKNCKNLTELHLRNTKVSDSGLKHLAGLKKLGALDLHGTRVTAAGVAELQEALPKCKIDWDRKPGP